MVYYKGYGRRTAALPTQGEYIHAKRDRPHFFGAAPQLQTADGDGHFHLSGHRTVGYRIPEKNILLSTGTPKQKVDMLSAARMLQKKGYKIFATGGSSNFLTENGVENTRVYWPSEPERQPQALDMLHRKEIDMVVNIPKNLTAGELDNGYKIRRAAIDLNIPLITNARLASAFINAFCTMTPDDLALPFAWTMLAENCRITIPIACGWSRRWWRPAA